MKSRTKIWLGVGVFVVAGVGAPGAAQPRYRTLDHLHADTSDIAVTRALSHSLQFAEAAHMHANEAGEQGGEKGNANLPPDLDFALKISQIRGHLLVGDQLIKEKQWAAALPHFLHPSEELYEPLRPHLKEYKTPPFSTALKLLANVVKAKKGGADYDNALKAVNDALAAADAGLKEKQKDWNSFTIETAIELMKSATGARYEEAIVKGRIAKPVEYQDARGFIWQGESMIEAIAPALEQKDKDALANVRAGIAELKKGWPTAVPPKTPVKDYATALSDVSKIELAAGKLM